MSIVYYVLYYLLTNKNLNFQDKGPVNKLISLEAALIDAGPVGSTRDNNRPLLIGYRLQPVPGFVPCSYELP